MVSPVLSAGFRLALRVLAPAGRKSHLSVLIFHRVLEAHDPLQPSEPTAQEFENQLRWVKAWFNVLPLSEAVARLRNATLPERPLVITFDDGYADNHVLALPVLRRLGLPATFFIATAFLDGGRMFNDTVIESVRQFRGPILDLGEVGLGTHPTESQDEKRMAIDSLLRLTKYLPLDRREKVTDRIGQIAGVQLPPDLMMTSHQVASLSACGMEVGGHTSNHPILARLEQEDARREIVLGRQKLEEMCGRRITLFAYPNGKPDSDYTRATVALVREAGFEAAVSTSHGAIASGSDLYQIPRFTPWSRQNWRYGIQLLHNLVHARPRFAA